MQIKLMHHEYNSSANSGIALVLYLGLIDATHQILNSKKSLKRNPIFIALNLQAR